MLEIDGHTAEKLESYYSYMSELYRIQCILALLGWDQRVYMPPGASKNRAEQIEYLCLALHRKFADPKLGDLVGELYDLRDGLSAADQVNVRETKRVLDI